MTTDDRTVKVRRPHRCYVCGERIEHGETCVMRAGFDDGPWRVWMHPDCERFTADWTDSDWEVSFPGDVTRAEVAEALKGAKR